MSLAKNNKSLMQVRIQRVFEVSMKVYNRAKLSQHSAMMAYYTLLSLFPLLLVLANLIPLLPINVEELLDILATILPENILGVVEPILVSYLQSASGGAITIGLLTALWSASALVSNLKVILNEIYDVTDISQNFLINRILAPIIFLVIIGAMSILLFAFIFGDTLVNFIENLLNVQFVLWETLFSLRTPILVIVLLFVFSLIYQLIPDNKTPYKYALPGAVLSTIGMLLLSELFTLYVNLSNNDALSNAAIGSFVALMLYLFVVYMIILSGAFLNAVIFELKNKQSMREATLIEDQEESTSSKEKRLVLQGRLKKVYPKTKSRLSVSEEREGKEH